MTVERIRHSNGRHRHEAPDEAKGRPINVVPMHKFGGGRQRKTDDGIDNLIRRELSEHPRLIARESNNCNMQLLEDVAVQKSVTGRKGT